MSVIIWTLGFLATCIGVILAAIGLTDKIMLIGGSMVAMLGINGMGIAGVIWEIRNTRQ